MADDKVIKGAVHAVPCPFCGKANDLRDLEGQQLMDTGHEIDCDHCGNIMEIASIQTMKVIGVRQAVMKPVKRQIQQPPQPQHRGLVGTVKKFLKP